VDEMKIGEVSMSPSGYAALLDILATQVTS